MSDGLASGPWFGRICACLVGVTAILLATPCYAQGVVGDLLGGKLVNPKVGQWAMYDLLDTKGGQKYLVREAIVGEEEVDRKPGYWVEFEITPPVGFKEVFKMLLTGPAGDPANVRRVIEKSGIDPAREVPVDASPGDKDNEHAKRTSLGMEPIATNDGPIRAEHFEVETGKRTMHVWVNEQVTPSGVVKLKAPDGEMTLRNYGIGGSAAKSIITEKPLAADAPATPRTQPQISAGAGDDATPNPKTPRKLRVPAGAQK